MVMLSYKNIERIANETLEDYLGAELNRFKPINIKGLVTEYLGLSLRYRTLSENGHILGLTTFEDVDVEIWDYKFPNFVFFKKGTVLIDWSLTDKKMVGRHNFTLSHEGAHQLLAKLYPEIDLLYTAAKVKSYRELRTNADWQEWQADNLASALLMPQPLLEHAAHTFFNRGHIEELHPIINRELYEKFKDMSLFLGVSKRALAIRMKKIGLLGNFHFDYPTAFMDIRMEAQHG